jgi:simple sugar transport system permease protein
VGIPTGTLLFFFGACAIVGVFFRTRAGIAISAARSNPRFAQAAGISDQQWRIEATVLRPRLPRSGSFFF